MGRIGWVRLYKNVEWGSWGSEVISDDRRAWGKENRMMRVKVWCQEVVENKDYKQIKNK